MSTAAPLDLSHQPGFRMDHQVEQSRLTTFFRFLTAIPPLLWLGIWSIALWVTVPVTWFALLFTGRYPKGLYDFHAQFARYSTYASSYTYLATDRWPGFSGADDVDYPVHLLIGEPLEDYSRMKVLFRILLMIPVALIAYAMAIVAEVGAIIAWFVIVFTGKLPRGLYQMIRLGLSYVHRASPYYLLMTEDWPRFTDADDARALTEPVEGSGMLPAPVAAAPEAPQSPQVAPAAAAPEAPQPGPSGFDPPGAA